MTLNYGELRAKAPRVLLKDAVPLRIPFTVFIEPTNICNFKCVTCPQTMPDYAERAGYHQLMDMKLFDKVVREVADFGGCKALRIFFDGESLIHPKIGYMLKESRKITDRLELITNATLLTEKKAQEILDAEVDYIRISIYGIDPNKYEAFTGNKNARFTVDSIRENVLRLRTMRDYSGKRKPHIAVNMLDRSEWEDFQRAYKDVADEISSCDLHSWGSDFVAISTLSGDPNGACPSPFYTLVVRANGEVVPCCVAWERLLILGDANRESLLDIWNGEKFEALRKAHLAGKRTEIPGCAGCTMPFEAAPADSLEGLTVAEYESRIPHWMPGKPEGFMKVSYRP